MTTKADIVATGLYFGEGPRWHDGRLWFSDFYAHSVKSLDESGRVRDEFTVEHQPSGLGWMPDGRMLIVSMTDRRLLRRELDGTLVEHADLNGIATFHCNDMVVDAQGRAYVGNFGFDLDAVLEKDGVEAVLAEPGPPKAKVARVDPDGSVHEAASEMKFPNGSVITPDGKTLIVAETLGLRLTAFDIGAGGVLSNRRVWADLGGRVPDGICLDANGRVWVANPLGPECFLVAEGGEIVDTVDTGDNCYACMLGGSDGRTLYCLTAPSSVAHLAAEEPRGALRAATVSTPHAGLP